MKYCRKCKLKINTRYSFCPLCAAQLTDGQNGAGKPDAELELSDSEDDLYPRYIGVNRYNLFLRVLVFASIVSASTCLLINLLNYNGMLWSLLVAGGIGFFWAALVYPIAARKNIGHHITVDAASACVFFIVAQFVIGTKGWSLDYVVPFLFMAATTFISLVILIKRMKWREYALYQFIAILLGLLPVISVIAGLVMIKWPSIVSAFYSFVTLLGMFIFADKKYKNELIKRFHF